MSVTLVGDLPQEGAKVLIGLAQGKKSYDKRDALKQKDMKREIDRAMKER